MSYCYARYTPDDRNTELLAGLGARYKIYEQGE